MNSKHRILKLAEKRTTKRTTKNSPKPLLELVEINMKKAINDNIKWELTLLVGSPFPMSFYELVITTEFCCHWIQLKTMLYLKRNLTVESKQGNIRKHKILLFEKHPSLWIYCKIQNNSYRSMKVLTNIKILGKKITRWASKSL